MTVLFDTCVLIDSLQDRKPFSASSNKLLLAVAREEIKGYISAKSVADIYYLMHKATHDIEKTRDILAKIFSLFHISDTTASDCLGALTSEITDYEDALLAESAARVKIDCIVTRNTGDFKKSSVKIVSPEEFGSVLSRQNRKNFNKFIFLSLKSLDI